MYDLWLNGSTVLDPGTGLAGVHDVAVQNGLIARIASDIAPTESGRTIECCWWNSNEYCPHRACVRRVPGQVTSQTRPERGPSPRRTW